MDSSRSSEVSSSMAEFLEKEKMCQDPHKITEVAGTNTYLVGTVTAQDHMNSSSSDEEIGNLLIQMRQLLSPRDLDYLEANEGRSVEELLKEAEKLVQTTSPLFSNINIQSSCTESANRAWIATPPKSETKSDDSQHHETYDDSENEKINRLIKDMEDMANATSTLLQTPSAELSSKCPSPIQNENTPLEENITIDQDLIKDKEDVNLNSSLENPKSPSKEEELEKLDSQFENKEDDTIYSKEDVKKIDEFYNVGIDEKASSPKEANSPVVDNSSPKDVVPRKLLKINNRERLSLSDLEVPENRLFANSLSISSIKNVNLTNSRNDSGNADRDLKLKREFDEAEKKYMVDLERLRATYDEEVRRLNEQINVLNTKVLKYEKHISDDMGAGDHGAVTVSRGENGALDQLKIEINSQERLISGYQRENHKLFQEINAAKEQWKKEKEHLQEIIRTTSKAGGNNLLLQEQLKDARETIVRYQLELERYKMMQLNSELSGLRSESKRAKKQADLGLEINSLKVTVTQLQAALSIERTQNKTLSRDKDVLMRENSDLKRQVKEVEGIIKQRNRTDSNIASIVSGEGRVKELEDMLAARQATLVALQEQLEQMKEKYDNHITDLENRLVVTQEENKNFKRQQNEYVQKDDSEMCQPVQSIKKSNSYTSSRCGPVPASGLSGKEDAHLLATIRGMKLELTNKDKDIMRINRDLEDARKTNRRLQREREKQLKTASPHKPSSSEITVVKMDNKSTNVGGELADSTFGRHYNPSMYQEEIEAAALMRMENKSLREEIKRLSQDIITLHNKRLQDLRALQSEHEQEIQRLLNDYSTRHSQTTVAELQGQIYTQQMVITHLKEQLKQLTLLKEENAMLKLERDHLEKTLMGANKKVQELTTPEARQYQNLLEKFENLERRHEVREQKLQGIVRDLLARSSEPVPCGPVCRNKLLDKNREICYYRVEMDKILEALREFKRSK